ncbi:hypothetical protein TNCV_316171 [Trichonephila clavipes]|nr:hypothetical protein TNCV_316171 [Trichonephila clavipes]
MVFFYNIRVLISIVGFSPEENMSRVAVQTESRLIIEENSPQSPSFQDRCLRHQEDYPFLCFTVKHPIPSLLVMSQYADDEYTLPMCVHHDASKHVCDHLDTANKT